MEIHIPPLCDRPEDIPLLLNHLIKKHNPELKRDFQMVDEDVLRVLMSLPWKGNVRELDNVIEHTMILAEGNRITLKDLPASIVAQSQQHQRLLLTCEMPFGNLKNSTFCGFWTKRAMIARKPRNSSILASHLCTVRSKIWELNQTKITQPLSLITLRPLRLF